MCSSGGGAALARTSGPTRTSPLGSEARRGLQDHPTVKATALLEDALLDLTNRNDLVIDPFLGWVDVDRCGKAGGICYGVELDTQYVEVTIVRFRAATGQWGIRRLS